MKNLKNLRLSRTILALTAIAFSLTLTAQAQKYRILYTFQGGSDGSEPFSNLLPDGSGGFYGTTWAGGATSCIYDSSCGTVYHLSSPAQQGGAWTETQLHAFTGSASDGAFPSGNLVKDASGNLYGSTSAGGPANTGTVFELSPPAQSGGPWTETILHSFSYGTSDGDDPIGGLAWGPGGALYGVTEYGGTYNGAYCETDGCGTIFQLEPPTQQGGTWTENILYNFPFTGCCWSYQNLVYRSGKLFGTTFQLGEYYAGSVFQLTPPFQQGGQWSYQDIYSILPNNDNDAGYWLAAGVAFDSQGNLYGAANDGGTIGGGTVYELQAPTQTGGAWTFDMLHNFNGAPTDGTNSQTPLALDSKGNLYGVTEAGGEQSRYLCGDGCGVAFELSNSDGTWTETVLHEFTNGKDGDRPRAPVTVSNGVVYGTTFQGGTPAGTGIVFAIVP
jgi:uncharacterized repeat protein (TIGR03803 family)